MKLIVNSVEIENVYFIINHRRSASLFILLFIFVLHYNISVIYLPKPKAVCYLYCLIIKFILVYTFFLCFFFYFNQSRLVNSIFIIYDYFHIQIIKQFSGLLFTYVYFWWRNNITYQLSYRDFIDQEFLARARLLSDPLSATLILCCDIDWTSRPELALVAQQYYRL